MDRGVAQGLSNGSCYRRPVRLSVVIPALNEANRVVAAVKSARAPGVEVVVADGGSRDATRELAAAAGARVVNSPAGRAEQLAAGVRESRGDAILLLHADTRLPSGFDRAVASALEDARTIGGAFRIRFEEAGWALRVVEWGVRLRVAIFRLPYGDQALFVRRRTLDAIGGIPSTPIMEDLDLVRAMRGCGRLALLDLPVTTSARRYRTRGVARTLFRNAVASAAWRFGVDRRRIADWYQR
jgi:rSAM/selenodomain-associated transferase 2